MGRTALSGRRRPSRQIILPLSPDENVRNWSVGSKGSALVGGLDEGEYEYLNLRFSLTSVTDVDP